MGRPVFTARKPEEEIERLKREIPIERLVGGFGIELKRTGANRVGRCPFHDDREPPLIVTPEKNLRVSVMAAQSRYRALGIA